jgi:hypothetical protein
VGGDRLDPGRFIGPDEQHLVRGVFEREPGLRPEAPRAEAELAVAREREQIGLGRGLDYLALDPPSPRHHLRRARESAQRRFEKRLRLLIGNCPHWRTGRRGRMAAE